MEVSFIFVSQNGLIHELIGSVVRTVTHSQFAHVAIKFEDGIIEATMPKVHISKLDEFDTDKIKELITFIVTPEKYQEMHSTAMSHLNKWYGLDDCLISGLHTLFGVDLSILNLEGTEDCSCLGTIIARVLLPELEPGLEPCEVTPEDLRDSLLYFKQLMEQV